MTIRRDYLADASAILILIALWLFFFWRLFTPVEADQASLEKGDFSGQFVAFGAYQYARFAAGEVPLWNPYNNGGLPFIADTQAALFYPPRLLTIGISKLAGGWSYRALELEMTAHVLACTLFMYGLVRRMTLGNKTGSVGGAFIAAVIAGYGGFLTSYPPLQLALLEAAIWLPLALLGILEATRQRTIHLPWIVLTGFALGLSWMAGHPQTSYFSTFLLVAYFGFRIYEKGHHWSYFIGGTILFGTIAGGMAAVQLLPGFEYLARTTRAGFTFEAKGNGFPFRDVVQFIFPGVMSAFSPLYISIAGLALALVAIWTRLPGNLFWGIVAVVGLGLSLGANSPIFALLYNILPGMRFFRGQERAAFLVANSLAILAGLGAARLATWKPDEWPIMTRNIRRGLISLVGLCAAATALIFNEWLNNRELDNTLSIAILSTALAGGTVAIVWPMMNRTHLRWYQWLLAGLIVFDLFTVNMDAETNYDPVPPEQQLSMTPPPLLNTVLGDQDIPFRADGYRGIHDNFGSLYGIADIRGISPLFLDGPHTLIQSELINPTAWELFAVRYVFTDWDELPTESQIIARGDDRFGTVKLHRLAEPRPFATMLYNIAVVETDAAAYDLLKQTGFNARETIIINRLPTVAIDRGGSGEAQIEAYEPEYIRLKVNTDTNGLLSLAQVDYPGWEATLDGQVIPTIRAYGALMAVEIPTGSHTIELHYNPLSYRVGAIISLLVWATLVVAGMVLLIHRGIDAGNKRAAKLD